MKKETLLRSEMPCALTADTLKLYVVNGARPVTWNAVELVSVSTAWDQCNDLKKIKKNANFNTENF
jgi:hypothetical protein